MPANPISMQFGGIAGLGGFGPSGFYDPQMMGQFDPYQQYGPPQYGPPQYGPPQYGPPQRDEFFDQVIEANPIVGQYPDGSPRRLYDVDSDRWRAPADGDGMVGTLGGPGYGEYPLGTAGPRVDPSDPNYIPPPSGDGSSFDPVDDTGQGPVDDTGQGPVDDTGQGPVSPPSDQDPFASNVITSTASLDPTTQQLLFGLGGQGGFIPGAMRAAERTFFDEYGNPVVVPEEVAGFSPDQLAAMELARGQVGLQFPYIQEAEQEYRRGIGEERGMRQAGLEGLLESIGETERMGRGAVGGYGGRLGGVEDIWRGATGDFGGSLGESEDLLRGTTGGYDQGLTSQFYDPYEERVVQQTIEDIMERGDKADMAQRARDIQSGGESAFGSRARLGAEERREALGRGLGEAIGGLRSSGFRQAQGLGLGEFARQRAAERAAASGLSGLFGQRLGAQQALGQGLGSLASQRLGAQERLISNLGLGAGRAHQALFGSGQAGLGAQAGLGGFLTGLGGQAQGAGMADINMLGSMGGLQQQYGQRQLDAQRRNALQAQQAPMAQYQSLLPFMQMVPSGRHTTQTTFTPRPSPLQAGLAAGLGAFGAFGNFMNQQQPQQQYPYGHSGSPYG